MWRQEGEEKMDNVIMENAYINYDGCVQVDPYIILVSLWNKLIDEEGEDKGYGGKVFSNNKEFFKNSFDNAYDAAWAVSVGDYKWTDTFVFFNREGNLSSFSHWNDENSPIDIDRIDVSHLIDGLKKMRQTNKVDNIPRAIHDALEED